MKMLCIEIIISSTRTIYRYLILMEHTKLTKINKILRTWTIKKIYKEIFVV